MREFKKIIFTVGICVGFSVLSGSIHAFDGPTHKYVTRTSLSILEKIAQEGDNSNQNSLDTEKGKGKNIYSDFYTDKTKNIILEYCVKPDEDEIEGGFKKHFYNPATGLNFMGEEDSALNNFIRHYNNAVEKYNTSYIEEAFQEFGRALHFIEDLSTPVHTHYESLWEAGAQSLNHLRFEERCVAIQDKCMKEVKKDNLKYYLENTKKIIGKRCAFLSAELFFSLEKGILNQDTVAQYAVLNAQYAVTGVLHRFYNEIMTNSKSVM